MTSDPRFFQNIRVRLKHDPGRMGFITDKRRETSRGWKYQVRFDDGLTGYQPEYELEEVGSTQESWDSLLARKRFGRVSDLQRHLTHIHLSGKLANVVYSMDATNTRFLAYQYKPLLSFLESPSGGLLIADEVGLGKTIEAGLIWTEMRARDDARRLLVACPAMLRDKWRDELRNRFGVEAQVMDARGLLRELKRDKSKVPENQGIVCSIEGLRPLSASKSKENPRSPKVTLAKYLDQNADDDSLIDLCIIDEAHYLRNPKSQNNKLGRLLRGVVDNIVLLSATPVNLKSDDLFHLLNLIDPEFFRDLRDFPHVVEANAPLIRARDVSRNPGSSVENILKHLREASKYQLLADNRQLLSLISELSQIKHKIDLTERVWLADRIGRVNMLAHVINRTRKREVNEICVVRKPYTYDVEMDIHERKLYDLVTDEVRNYAAEKDVHEGFLLASPQRQVSSCMYAAIKGWQHADLEIRNMIYEDQGTDVEESEVRPLIQHLINHVLPKISLNDYWAVDSKYNKLENLLLNFFANNPNEKIIIFSYFKGTIDYLANRLSSNGIDNMVLYGGIKGDKQEYIANFRDSKSMRVMIASEVASEGVDLEFCKMLINYDLPWNPMKVEQRIGRLDRIGQESPAISIWNLCHAGTIDHKILKRLHTRLGVFERSIGELEPILGPVIQELTKNLLRHDLTQKEVERQIQQSEQAIEQERRNNEKLEGEAANLVAHGEYILRKIRAASDFRQKVNQEDLLRYVRFFLEKFAKGHVLQETDAERKFYNIQLPPEIAADFGEFILNNSSTGSTKLQTGQAVRCQFINKAHKLTPHVEQISQFHPFIRYISSFLDQEDAVFYPLISASVQVGQANGVGPGIYAFAVSRWRFDGIKVDEEIRARVIPVNSTNDADMFSAEQSLNFVNAMRTVGDDWLAIANRDDLLEGLDEVIWRCFDCIDDDFGEMSAFKENENHDRVMFQIKSIERHRKRRSGPLKATLQKHLETNSGLAPATRKKLMNLNSRCDVQVKKFQKRKKLKRSQDPICCGVIEVK